MADDDELGAAFGTVADLHQQCQLALWREGCFRLVENIDAVGIEPLLGKGKEALTVGFLVIMLGGVVCVGIVFFFGGHIIEALRPQEITAPRPTVAFGYGDGFMEAGVGVVGGEIIVSRAAFGIKTIGDAIASSSVDFPLPFSPTKKVTGRVNSSLSSPQRAGIFLR